MNLKLFWIRTDVFCKDKHKKHVHSATMSPWHQSTVEGEKLFIRIPEQHSEETL